jgi:hypothetical protein
MASKKDDQYAHVNYDAITETPGTDAPSHTELTDHSSTARLVVEDAPQDAPAKVVSEPTASER